MSVPTTVPVGGRRKRKHKKRFWGAPTPRSKPHPNDHQFKTSTLGPTINRLRNARTVTGTVVFALAMAFANSRDRLRLQMLQLSMPGTKVITVSENGHGLGNWPHMDCDFAVDRGHRTIAARIAAEKEALPGARIVVLVDHYWCELGYYEENYGMLWLATGAQRLLLAGAAEVLLPFDNGRNIPENRSGMAKMLAGRVHPAIAVDFVAGPVNPLWVASENTLIEDALGKIRGGDNAEQTRQWLDAVRPFVRCTSK